MAEKERRRGDSIEVTAAAGEGEEDGKEEETGDMLRALERKMASLEREMEVAAREVEEAR